MSLFSYPVYAITLALLCSACNLQQDAPSPDVDKNSAEPANSCGAAGRLTVSLVGSLQADVDWINTQVSCDSMPRPDGAGMRLRFNGEVKGERLAIIIAIPDLTSAEAAGEMPSNVTVSIEGSGRFFSTPDLDTCWTDILTQRAAGDLSGFHMIEGTLSCIAPLGELNGDGAVTIAEMSFNGIVDWQTP